MRICDLCGQPHAKYNVEFSEDFGGVKFHLAVFANKGGELIDICKDCAAKGALQVLGMDKPPVGQPEKS